MSEEELTPEDKAKQKQTRMQKMFERLLSKTQKKPVGKQRHMATQVQRRPRMGGPTPGIHQHKQYFLPRVKQGGIEYEMRRKK